MTRSELQRRPLPSSTSTSTVAEVEPDGRVVLREADLDAATQLAGHARALGGAAFDEREQPGGDAVGRLMAELDARRACSAGRHGR